ncbi:unnamed protein product [Caenorhabditis sp. 36 PRJEB53466]|nr:unnamed protein product [Caenorhabditis sp. 36 PRJEB53466]
MTRRIAKRTPTKKTETKSMEKKKSDALPPTEASEPSTSRPKRNTRKNVLYNNATFDVRVPGQPKNDPVASSTTEEESLAASSTVAVSDSPEDASEPPQVLETAETPEQILSGGSEGKTETVSTKRARKQPEKEEGAKKSKFGQKTEDAATSLSTGASSSSSPRKKVRFDRKPQKEDEVHDPDTDADTKVSKTDEAEDGPPILGPEAETDGSVDEEHNETDNGDGDSDDGEPPNLERQPPAGKLERPRPSTPKSKKKPLQIRLNTARRELEKPPKVVPPPVVVDRPGKPPSVVNKASVKLFQDDLEVTEQGDNYAVVINGCLTELLRKERIMDVLTCEDRGRYMTSNGWMLDKPPRLPPLTTDSVCFAFYIDGSKVVSTKDLSVDDLRPWSSSSLESHGPLVPIIKPTVRKHPVAYQEGKWVHQKMERRADEIFLIEYSARLPREPRLRKKIYYLFQNQKIIGNVLILYDYASEGNAPVVIQTPRENALSTSALRYVEEEFDESGVLIESPFETELVKGERGGIFLKCRNNKMGLGTDKKKILEYIWNKPDSIGDLKALNKSLPDLPPLTEKIGVFVYFVPAANIASQMLRASDGLSPWSTNPLDANAKCPRVRSTKRSLVQNADGTVTLLRNHDRDAVFNLVELQSTLARCTRIKKRVLFIQQNTILIVGYVCYIYEFVEEGPLPVLLPNSNTNKTSQRARWRPPPKQQAVAEVFEGLQEEEEEEEFDEIETEVDAEESGEFNDDDYAMGPDGMVGSILQDEPFDVPGPAPAPISVAEEQVVDILNNGRDDEFQEDMMMMSENTDPYYSGVRKLESGHTYLTVRHNKLACTFDSVLEYIANSNVVEESGVLNTRKPGHPPIVSNARAYVFFVVGSSIFPHDINKDDFSPWSHNSDDENPTCYRTKVRKLGVVIDPATQRFLMKTGCDYRTCPFHLTFLYSINPREPRLKKRVYYLMETDSKMVVSHALIMYDYTTEGNLPKITAGNYKCARKKKDPNAQMYEDSDEEREEYTEEEREPPFSLHVETALDGCVYMKVNDGTFWNDRRTQLEFLVNPHRAMLDEMGALNIVVPELPPATTGTGSFAYFVSGLEKCFLQLTSDKLVPWSSSSHTSGTTIRPKTVRIPLALNRGNRFRMCKRPIDEAEFILHTYTATLPRNKRLKKKVVYVVRDNVPFGNALVLYMYTEPGDVILPLEKEFINFGPWLASFDPFIRNELYYLLQKMEPAQVCQVMLDSYRVHVNVNMLYYVQGQDIRAALEELMAFEEYVQDTDSPTAPEIIVEQPNEYYAEELIEGDSILVESTVTVEQDYEPIMNEFLEQDLAVVGFVRGSQRDDAFWRIAGNQFGTKDADETFDELFKLLHAKNEERLFQNVNQMFGVEICDVEEVPMEQEETVDQLVEQPVEESVAKPVESSELKSVSKNSI